MPSMAQIMPSYASIPTFAGMTASLRFDYVGACAEVLDGSMGLSAGLSNGK